MIAYFKVIPMNDELKQHLKKYHFDKQYQTLIKKLKNKSIVIYGAGLLFQEIQANYDLSKLNIIGISDKKFGINEENQTYLGYKIIPKNNIFEQNPDYILVATLKYIDLVNEFTHHNENVSTKVKPLAKQSLIKDLISVLLK